MHLRCIAGETPALPAVRILFAGEKWYPKFAITLIG